MNESQRKEPVFDPERAPSKPAEDDVPFPIQDTRNAPLPPAVRFTLYAVSALCLFVLVERIHDRYQAHRAMQYLNEQIEAFGDSLDQMSEEQAARVRATREQRARTTTGKWLAKNCADWTRSYEDMPTATGRAEMRTHCAAHERYLASGIAPAGAPR
jgi:hypothetical protein